MSKSVLITGAARGIGSEIARIFAANNFRVIINYNNSEILAKKLESDLKNAGCDCIAIQADVSDEASVNRMIIEVKKFTSHIDVLVNNAGIALQKLFCDTSAAEWDKIFKTNVTSVYNCCKAVVPTMIKNHYGNIVNISSIWGIYGASMEVAYSASKAAVIGLTKALAKELGPSGINVNCVAPGVINTEMISHLTISEIKEIEEMTSLGRLGHPKEVAELVFFLASEKAAFITGQVISPNGGFPF